MTNVNRSRIIIMSDNRRIIQFESFTRIPVFFFHTIGLVPFTLDSDKPSPRFLANVWFAASALNCAYSCLAQIIYSLLYLDMQHFVELTENVLCIGFQLLAFAKIGAIVHNRQALSQLVSELAVIFPQSLGQQERFGTRSLEKRASLMANIYAWLQMVMIWMYNLIPLLSSIVRWSGWSEGRSEWSLDFVYQNWYPFDAYARGTFEIAYVCQWWGAYFAAVGIMGSDLLLAGLVIQMCMHFERIGQRIRESKPTGDDWTDQVKMEQHIRKHTQLLRLSDDLDQIFCKSILCNVVSSILIICVLGFLILTAGQSQYVFKFGLTLISCTGQIFTVCRLGQILIDAVYGFLLHLLY